ncbi:hypothetical protein AMTRI_Chr09g17460 [Amborella trichopoda]
MLHPLIPSKSIPCTTHHPPKLLRCTMHHHPKFLSHTHRLQSDVLQIAFDGHFHLATATLYSFCNNGCFGVEFVCLFICWVSSGFELLLWSSFMFVLSFSLRKVV